jgi:phosphatidylglycerol:prolipoprotein diacylglycerol transferase
LIFTHALIDAANNVRRFPVQLLEALFNIALFFALHGFRQKEKFKCQLLYVYLLAYAMGRFFIEFFRGDDFR